MLRSALYVRSFMTLPDYAVRDTRVGFWLLSVERLRRFIFLSRTSGSRHSFRPHLAYLLNEIRQPIHQQPVWSKSRRQWKGNEWKIEVNNVQKFKVSWAENASQTYSEDHTQISDLSQWDFLSARDTSEETQQNLRGCQSCQLCLCLILFIVRKMDLSGFVHA